MMECAEYMKLFLRDHHQLKKSDAKLCYQYKCVLGGPVEYHREDDKLLSLYQGKKTVKVELQTENLNEEEIRRMNPIWKAEIEKTLTELSDLREELQPVAFASELWETYRGAYGNVVEDVAFLFCREDLIPETEKIRRLDFKKKEDYEIIFDNLCENLTHQLSLYPAMYLAVPYLVLLLEKKRRDKDERWEHKIIGALGDILTTDIPACGGGEQNDLPDEVWESYQKSVARLQEMTKDYLQRNLEQAGGEEGIYFCAEVLAILSDREAAFEMLLGGFEQCPVACPDCDYYDEDMEADGLAAEELLEGIEPAEDVIGKWDKKDYTNTYVWFSNLMHMVNEKEAWKVRYYYGTYTCPECGSKGMLIEWMKRRRREEA